MKKTNKRKAAKYAGLNQNLNLKSRYEELDQNYINGVYNEENEQVIRGLNDSEKDWLNRFNEEYTIANFNHSGERVHPIKRRESEKNQFLIKTKRLLNDQFKKINEIIKSSVINSKKKIQMKKVTNQFKKSLLKILNGEFKKIEDSYKKDSYDRNNSRNRCIITKSKASGSTYLFDDLPEVLLTFDTFEQAVLEEIDLIPLRDLLKQKKVEEAISFVCKKFKKKKSKKRVERLKEVLLDLSEELQNTK